jgi:Tfp pilus assembly protein PilN
VKIFALTETLKGLFAGATVKARILKRALRFVIELSLGDERIAPGRAAAVSIDEDRITVVCGSRFLSRIRIKGVKEYLFADEKSRQPEGIATRITLALHELRVRGRRVTLSIPKKWCVVKTADFPDTVADHLPQVVAYELDRLTPFSSDQALYDFSVIDRPEGTVRIVLTSARSSAVTPLVGACRERGILVERITINPSAMANFCRYCDGTGNTVFARFRETGYEGGAVRGRHLIAAFANGPEGGGSESDAEQVILRNMAKLTNQAQASLVLMGRNGRDKKFFGELPGKVYTGEELMQRKPHLSKRSIDPSSVPAIGALLESLWPGASGFDLLSGGKKPTRRPPLFLSVILAVAILMAAGTFVAAPLTIEGKKLQEIERQIALHKGEMKQVEALVKQVEAIEAERNAIESFRKDRTNTLTVVKEVTTTLPRDTWLSRLRISESTIDLEGYSSSATTILPRLEASPLLCRVEFAAPTFRDVRQNTDRFVIRTEIEKREKQPGGGRKDENKT